jgi:hypothetical protein
MIFHCTTVAIFFSGDVGQQNGAGCHVPIGHRCVRTVVHQGKLFRQSGSNLAPTAELMTNETRSQVDVESVTSIHN